MQKNAGSGVLARQLGRGRGFHTRPRLSWPASVPNTTIISIESAKKKKKNKNMGKKADEKSESIQAIKDAKRTKLLRQKLSNPIRYKW